MTAADTGPGKEDGDRANADDHLATTRMPPIGLAPLPPARVPPSRPPPAFSPPVTPSAAVPSPALAPPTPAPPRVDAPRTRPAPPTQTSAWWRAFAAALRGAEPEGLRARIAVACVVCGLASIVLALVMALRPVPGEFFVPSTVTASIVLSRALIAVGFLGGGLALLRAAERLYFR